MYKIKYMDEVKTIEYFTEFVKNALEYWLSIHTEAESWTQEWAMDNNYQYLLESTPIIKNNYFSFDLKNACYEQMAIEQINLYARCSECGLIWESGYMDCCNDLEEEELTNDDITDLTEWFNEIEAQIPENIIKNAMIEKGFPIYQKAINPLIYGIVDEITDVLNDIQSSNNNQEKLESILMASHIMHVNGNILKDYGEKLGGLDYNQIESIQQSGLNSVFTDEQIQEYITGV